MGAGGRAGGQPGVFGGLLPVLCLHVLLGGCDATAHIRLFQPAKPSEPAGMDASAADPDTASPPEPMAEAEPRPRDASQPESMPDRFLPPPRRDSGDPTPPPPEAGPPASLADSLIVHYDFSGEGDEVADRVGDRNARLMGGATLSASRPYVALDGVDDYVDLPNGLISGLHSATMTMWMTWDGGPCWQRIFDFGISNRGEGEVGQVVTSLFVTPYACGVDSLTAMVEIGSVQQAISDDATLPMGRAVQVALVVDGDRQTLALYVDDTRVADGDVSFQLGELSDLNNWLGRSQWRQDAPLRGLIGDFRIYSRVLSDEEIAMLHEESTQPAANRR